MSQVYGTVTDENISDAPINKNCEATCYLDTDCMLAFFDADSHCLLISYNATEKLEVVLTSKSDGLQTNPPSDSCPSFDEFQPVFNMGDNSIPWQKEGDTWIFRKCVGDWKLFKRTDPNITVCMQAYPFGTPTSRNDSDLFCGKMGFKVTGVATVEEMSWILSRMNVLISNFIKYQGFFVDGIRPCTDNVCGRYIFDWSDGYTNGTALLYSSYTELSEGGENCLTVTKNGQGLVRLNDASCDPAGTGIGVVCGYKMLL
ncbi:hypothetical protein GCK72_020245 [Caenorhabditis remanei]|uniref:PAN-3 domain-containing protein n=1 Tax=Caenorhabditis remanei TaxID=31234 RepID=A0A6A5GES4_CAERE|nr:hypothetical protein GCK72_020245 [Caenorhabditis remanei]KAF1753688.1 hypothetical protein GCK72_020245 [Caenorhabditis remanei]